VRVDVGTALGWSEVSNEDTAMVGSPANTIPELLSSSLSPILMEGRGVNVAGCDPGSTIIGGAIIGSTMIGGLILGTTMLGGSTMTGIVGSMMVGTGGRTISGTAFVGESSPILPISAERSPSLPSLISVTVEGNRLPVFLSYPCARPTRGVVAPIPLGRPLSRLLDATTTTGGFGRGRLLVGPNPAALSKDLTDDMVSDRSRTEGETGDWGGGLRTVEGPASGTEAVLMGEGKGRVEDGRTIGDGIAGDLTGDPGVFGRKSVRIDGGGMGRISFPEGGRGRAFLNGGRS
jgi:hypothetical protein